MVSRGGGLRRKSFLIQEIVEVTVLDTENEDPKFFGADQKWASLLV